jgi:hypothetical protein
MSRSDKSNEHQSRSGEGSPNLRDDASLRAGPASEVQEFPLDVLPPPVARLAREASESLSAPPDLVAVPALAVLAAAIGRARAIRIKPGWTEPAVVYTAVVAEPGERKSPALRFATRPLHVLQQQLKDTYAAERGRYDTEFARFEAEQAQWRAAARSGGSQGEPPTRPSEPAMALAYVSDSTWEALAGALTRNPRGIIYVADELTGWARSHNAYRGGKGSDRQAWLSAWSASSVVINRKSLPEPIVLADPFVAVVGGLPPDVLGELADERGRQDGFIHRLLFSYPDSMPTRWTERGVSKEVEDGYGALFAKLRGLEAGPDGGPIVVDFSKAGREAFVAFLEHDQHPAQDRAPEALRGPFAKLEAYSARLALIIHCCRYVLGEVESEDVDPVSVEAAAQRIRYFRSHAARVYGRLGSTNEDREVEKFIAYARRHGGRVSLRDLQRNGVAGVRTAGDVTAICKSLEERELGAVEQHESISGQTSRVLVLSEATRHPTVLLKPASDAGLPVGSTTRQPPDSRRGVGDVSGASTDTASRMVEPKTEECRVSGPSVVVPELPADAPEWERAYWHRRTAETQQGSAP